MSSRRNDRYCRIGLLLAFHAATACEPADADPAYDRTGDDMEELVVFTEHDDLDESSSRPCITPEEYEALFADVARNTTLLGLDDRTAGPRPALAPVQFEWPLRQVGAADPGYHAISNYVDHAGASQVLDQACGTRTYDGHRGTDIALWPFPWLKVDESEIEVVAAAPGTIVSRQDGNFDRQCAWVSGAQANLVAVKHADGSTAYYYHMKQGSVTNKQVGDAVATGERLGVAASSGVSTGPHLHFEVHLKGIAQNPSKFLLAPGSPLQQQLASSAKIDPKALAGSANARN
jgi:murein DD-endopeptidase MepM/ murein hydrolase activator NlpD